MEKSFQFLKGAWQKATYSKQLTSKPNKPNAKKTNAKYNYITIPHLPKKQIPPNIQTFTQAKHNGDNMYTYTNTQHIYKKQTTIINANI